mgnify:CR=1 FL=1
MKVIIKKLAIHIDPKLKPKDEKAAEPGVIGKTLSAVGSMLGYSKENKDEKKDEKKEDDKKVGDLPKSKSAIEPSKKDPDALDYNRLSSRKNQDNPMPLIPLNDPK